MIKVRGDPTYSSLVARLLKLGELKHHQLIGLIGSNRVQINANLNCGWKEKRKKKNFKSSKSFPIKFRPTTFSKNFAKIKIVLRRKVFFSRSSKRWRKKRETRQTRKKLIPSRKSFSFLRLPSSRRLASNQLKTSQAEATHHSVGE